MNALLVAAALLFGAPSGLPVAPEQPPRPSLKVGEVASKFLLETLNPEASGTPWFSTKRYVGSSAKGDTLFLWLNFAASHCGPCKRELPELKTREAAWRAAGLPVVTAVVVIDREAAGIEAMRSLLVDELGVSFPALSDRFAVVGRRYKADVLPLNVLIGRDGRIHWLRAGFEEDTLDAGEAAMKALLQRQPEQQPEQQPEHPQPATAPN